MSLWRAVDRPTVARTAFSRASVSADGFELNVGTDGSGRFDLECERQVARGHDLILGDPKTCHDSAVLGSQRPHTGSDVAPHAFWVTCTFNLHRVLPQQSLHPGSQVRRWRVDGDFVGGPGGANSAARRTHDLNDRHARDGGGGEAIVNFRGVQRVTQGHGHVFATTFGADGKRRPKAQTRFGTEAAAIGEWQTGATGYSFPRPPHVVLRKKTRGARLGEPNQIPAVRCFVFRWHA